MTFPLSVLEALLACSIVAVGSVLQGSVGFGLGPLAVPLLVLIDPVFVPGPLLLAALLLTALMYIREQHAVRLREIQWAVLGRLVGTVFAALLLRAVPRDELSLLFAVMVLAALAILIGGFHLSITPFSLLGAGTLSGFMGTASAVGGAPMALLYQRADGPRLRGTLSGVFVIGTIMGILLLVIVGRFGLREVQSSVVLFPGIVLGFLISRRTSRILDRGFVRPAVFVVSACSALILIIRYCR